MSNLQALAVIAVSSTENMNSFLSAAIPVVKSAIKRIMRSRFADEDILNSALLTLWTKISEFDPSKGEVSTFINWIVRGHISNEFRKNTKRFQCLSQLEDDDQQIEIPQGIQHEDVNFQEYLEVLDQRDREIMIDLYLNNMTLEEVGIKIGMSKMGVMNRRNMALQTIKSAIQ